MRYVVIGASAAGINAIKTVRELRKDDEIVLISEDKDIYSRCILYHHLKGIRNLEQLCFVELDFIEKYRVDWKKGRAVIHVDSETQRITLDDNSVVPYDRLLIASGSHSFFPPIQGLKEAKNVVGFRDFEDVLAIERVLPTVEHIVVMGGGLVGIDVIAGLLPHKKDVMLVEMGDRMLPIQLDAVSAKTYQDAFEKEGVKQFYGTGIASLKMEGERVVGVILQDGTELPCDLLICCAGVRSNVEFLENSGILCDRFGLIYDAHGKTNKENVYGAGDVSGKSPIWPVAVKEGIIAAYNMCGIEKSLDDFFASKSTMNFLGIPTLSLGKTYGYDDTYQVEMSQDEKGNYKKIIHKDGVIHGALLQGDLSYAGILTQLIREKIDVSKVKKPLFDIDYSDFFHITDNFEFTYEKREN